jgi:hypothetical protein
MEDIRGSQSKVQETRLVLTRVKVVRGIRHNIPLLAKERALCQTFRHVNHVKPRSLTLGRVRKQENENGHRLLGPVSEVLALQSALRELAIWRNMNLGFAGLDLHEEVEKPCLRLARHARDR